MTGDTLSFHHPADDGTVWLILHSPSGGEQKKLIWLPTGFHCEDVCEAALATGWVRQHGDHLLLTCDVSGDTLRDVLEAMLGYFDQPGVPSAELLEVQTAVSEYESAQALGAPMPWYAYAWLDAMVREDLADEARSASRIWLKSRVVIDPARFCERRVGELVARYSQCSAGGRLGSLAPSIPTRTSRKSRARTG